MIPSPDTQDTEELKPCPFCAAKMEMVPLLRDKDKPEAGRECVAKHPGDPDSDDCLLSGCGLHPNKWLKWNTRPDSPVTVIRAVYLAALTLCNNATDECRDDEQVLVPGDDLKALNDALDAVEEAEDNQ